MNKEQFRPVAIIVEGVDFLHFLRHRIMGDPQYSNIWLYDFMEDGFSLERWLRSFTARANFEQRIAIGILRDKEEDGTATERSVQESLKKAGCVVPSEANIVQFGTPSTAYYLLPHNSTSGCLEHAMIDAAINLDSLNCAKEFLECTGRPYDGSNWSAKAVVRSMISVSDDPDRKLGETSITGLWNWQSESLAKILSFIKMLNDLA